MNLMKFKLGQVVATPAALALLESTDAAATDLLNRHACGDYGDLCAEDCRMNDSAIEGGGRVMSTYPVGDGSVWVITEWDRSATTLLLPEEY